MRVVSASATALAPASIPLAKIELARKAPAFDILFPETQGIPRLSEIHASRLTFPEPLLFWSS